MSPRYVSDDVDEVRERANIVEVIGDHVRLRKAGRVYRGLCPFHQEKTPSFSVDPDKGLYYCFGCNQGGSVFTFLEQVEGLSFPEAVESLAQRYGVELRQSATSRKGPSPRARLFALQEAAVEKYQERLAAKDAETVRAYLEARGITPELTEKYKIGFGGWKRDGFMRVMLRAGYKLEELTTAGLATRDAQGQCDTFYGRVLFPIFDPAGRAVGIGGRVLPPEHRLEGAPEGPKYMNSRESPIFKKSRILYGTNWARTEVMSSKRLVLVEGYTDVIALHAAGIGEAVATCGTSLTEDHMKEISTRFGDVRVVLCLDADVAGQAAMSRDRTEELASSYSEGGAYKKSATGWLPIGRGWLPEVHVAHLPQGKDPADFVRAEGADGVLNVISKAVPLVEFLLKRSIEGEDLREPDGRARAVRRGVGVLREVGDSLMRHEYALWLSDRTGLDANEITRELKVSEPTSKRRVPTASVQAPVVLSGTHRIEREALRGLLVFPELFNDDELAPSEDDFTLPVHRSLFRLAASELTEHGSVDAGRILSRVEDSDLQRIVGELSVGETPEGRVVRDTLSRLRSSTLDRHIVERKSRLRALDPNREAAAYDALFEELLGLEKQKRALTSLG